MLGDRGFRYANQRIVFRTIRQARSVTRRQLTQQTDLSFQTVSNIVSELLEMGLVMSDGLATNQPAGKPAESIKIDPRGLFAIGVLLDRMGFQLNLIDLLGNSRVRVSESLPSGQPDTTLRRITAISREVLAGAQVPENRFAGIGIASPGPIDFRYGAVSRPPSFPGWAFVPLQQRLADMLNCSVSLIKDSHAAALGEIWALNTEAPSSLFYLYFSAGIGGALVIDNRIWTGFLGNAGEIGHVTVAHDPECDCGRRGCLEAVWSLGRSAGQAGIPVDRFAKLLKTKTAPYWDEWQQGIPLLTQATLDVVNVLEPELIVIGGPQGEEVGPDIISALNGGLQREGFVRHLRPIAVRPSMLSGAASIGAGLLQLNTSLTSDIRSSGEIGLGI